MKNTNLQNTHAEKELRNLFLLSERADNLETTASECNAMITVLLEAVDYMNNDNADFADSTIIPHTVKVIQKYSSSVKSDIEQLREDLSTLFNTAQSKCMAGGECRE